MDEVRAGSDAILVGARTVRLDNPRLLVRSAERQAQRAASGLERSPWKVTVTASGDLDPHAAFFTEGEATKLVYCPRAEARRIAHRLGDTAVVVGLGPELVMADLLSDLAGRGARRLMVEGGGKTITQFLAADLVDELQLAVAPVFVGDRHAPRFVGDARFPWSGDQRAVLAEARTVGDVVLLRYALSDRFVHDGDASSASPGQQSIALGRS